MTYYNKTGRHLTDEHKAKLSAARKGQSPSLETRDKQSRVMRARAERLRIEAKPRLRAAQE